MNRQGTADSLSANQNVPDAATRRMITKQGSQMITKHATGGAERPMLGRQMSKGLTTPEANNGGSSGRPMIGRQMSKQYTAPEPTGGGARLPGMGRNGTAGHSSVSRQAIERAPGAPKSAPVDRSESPKAKTVEQAPMDNGSARRLGGDSMVIEQVKSMSGKSIQNPSNYGNGEPMDADTGLPIANRQDSGTLSQSGGSLGLAQLRNLSQSNLPPSGTAGQSQTK